MQSKATRNEFISYMHEAIAMAEEAFSAEEVPVGCVIVERKTGIILAKTHNNMQKLKNPIAHAEILAINEACIKINNKTLSHCDIYITLEPCVMCAAALANARIGRIYYGAADPKQGGVENGVRYYTRSDTTHRPEIFAGLGDNRCRELMQSFFRKIRKNVL